MDPVIEALPDRINETLAGKNILITGATGFMGKVLIEKLLRSCYDINLIYVLVRTKKGKEPKLRLEEIFNGPLFDKVRALRGGTANLLSKIKAIPGDVSILDLAMSVEDKQDINDNIHIIYHGAATVRFDEELKKAVLLNTRGTKQMLDLARKCKKLELFCHISTSYCHLNEKLLKEKPYPPPADPHKIIKCVEWLEDDVVNAMTEKILDTYPNTYAFTKALSEGLVEEAMADIPAVIVRPSIVVPIWKEPLPGWTDNINGPTGLLIGAGKGVIRTMYCNSSGYADYVPVDITANILLVVAWNYITKKHVKDNVINLTSSAEIKVSWQDMIDIGRSIVTEKIPLNGVAWYPGGSMKSSKWAHNICLFLFHIIPALIIDSALYLTGNKPILMRVQRRISKGFEVFEYYANKQWDFESNIIQEIRQSMNAKESLVYKMDGNGLNIHEYFESCIRATRLYMLNEPESTLPAARRHMKVMWFVDRCTKLAFFAAILWLMSDYIGMLFNYVFQSEVTTSSTLSPTKSPVSSI